MKKKKIVIALGHEALGSTLPEQHEAAQRTARAVADFIRDDYPKQILANEKFWIVR